LSDRFSEKNAAMRLLAMLALVVLCAFLPAASAAASGGDDVIADCTKHGTLTRHYSQKDYEEALASLPADVDEYGDCRNVIRDAQVAGAANNSDGGGGGGATGGGDGTTAGFSQPGSAPSGPSTITKGSGHSAGATSQPAPGSDDPAAVNPSDPKADNPTSAAENQALIDATRNGGDAVKVGRDVIQPGAQSSSFSQGLPAPVVGVLSLLGVMALAGCLVALRRKLRGMRADD